MNEVTVVGNVVSNPVYRDSQDKQTQTVRFTITLNDDTGQSIEPPVLQQVVAFGRLADNVNESLQQGLEAVVVGKLTADTYQSETRIGPSNSCLSRRWWHRVCGLPRQQ
jgi:single-stranded DNA-binding protein